MNACNGDFFASAFGNGAETSPWCRVDRDTAKEPGRALSCVEVTGPPRGERTLNIGQILKVKGRSVTTARQGETVQEIANRLSQRKIGAIVIIGDNGVVSGIISERDLIRVIAQHGPNALMMPVSEVMTRDVISCCETTPVDEIMELMTTRRFRHVPVVEDGALIGIISIGDVVKHHVAEVELEVSAMRGYLATG